MVTRGLFLRRKCATPEHSGQFFRMPHIEAAAISRARIYIGNITESKQETRRRRLISVLDDVRWLPPLPLLLLLRTGLRQNECNDVVATMNRRTSAWRRPPEKAADLPPDLTHPHRNR